MGTKYEYHTNCINSDSDSIHKMMDTAKPVTYRTIQKHIRNLRDFTKSLGYDRYLTMKNDFCVSYFKGFYQGKKCYIISWSAIEHIFLEES